MKVRTNSGEVLANGTGSMRLPFRSTTISRLLQARPIYFQCGVLYQCVNEPYSGGRHTTSTPWATEQPGDGRGSELSFTRLGESAQVDGRLELALVRGRLEFAFC